MALDISKLNKHDAVYHQLTYDILTSPELNFRPADRVVIDTIGVFGNQVKYDLTDGTIPLSNTKNIAWKTQLFPEIVGFLRNENNLKWYLEKGMKIWTPNAFNFYRKNLDDSHPWKNLGKDTPEFNAALKDYETLVLSGKDPKAGDMGEFYPRQWRSFKGVEISDEDFLITPKQLEDLISDISKSVLAGETPDPTLMADKYLRQWLTDDVPQGVEVIEVDQFGDMIERLKTNPSSRYHLVSAWNPYDVFHNKAALAPCHVLFQAYIYEDVKGVKRLSMKLHQRSADHLLGVAFNGPQYGTLTATTAALVGVEPGMFYHSFGDIHLYVGAGERSAWYKNKENLAWLQNELKTKHPNDVLDNLLRKLPGEGRFPGYDHVPYSIMQLGRESNAKPPTLTVTAKDLNTIDVGDLVVDNYERPPKLLIKGQRPEMAS